MYSSIKKNLALGMVACSIGVATLGLSGSAVHASEYSYGIPGWDDSAGVGPVTSITDPDGNIVNVFPGNDRYQMGPGPVTTIIGPDGQLENTLPF